MRTPAVFGFCAALVGCGRFGFDGDPSCPTYVATMAPYAAGAGTVDDPFQICSPAHLTELATRPGDRESRFLLLRDLDFAGVPFDGIGTAAAPFAGFIDGGGHTISNIDVTGAPGEPAGFINAARFARVEDLTLVNVTVTGSDGVGAMIGACDTTHVRNTAVVNADINGVRWVGGLVGEAYECQFIGGSLTGTVGGATEWIGGLGGGVGRSTFMNIDATVDVNAPLAEGVGGIIGLDDWDPVIVQNVRVQANVVGNEDVGGLVGQNADGTHIYRSRFDGTVRGGRGVGGFAGANLDSPFHVYSTSVAAEVTGNTAVGGFSGRYYYRTKTFDSYFTGQITGTGANQASFGGFFGDVEYYGWTERSYVDATITSTASTVGGFMGRVGYWSASTMNYDVTHSFAAVNLTGSSPTSTISRWVGENTDPNPLVGVGSYYWAGGSCVNLGGGGCGASGGMAVADLTELQGSGGPPLATWDFSQVWQAQANAFPVLRLDQNHAPVVTVGCSQHAIVGLEYDCGVMVADADVNEVQVTVPERSHTCMWITPNKLALGGRPTAANLGACAIAYTVTDGAYTTPMETTMVDVHLGVVMTPADPSGTSKLVASHAVGSPPMTQVFTLTNNEAVPVSDLGITGLPSGDFRFVGGAYPGTGGTCTTTLAPGGSCTIAISFGATAAGYVTHAIELRFTAARGPVSYRFTLAGNGF